MFQLYEREILCTEGERAYWDAQSKFSDSVVTSAAIDPPELISFRLSLLLTRTTATGIREDVAVTGITMAHVLLGEGTTEMDSAELAAAESATTTWWDVVKQYFPSHLTLKEYRWHRYTAASNKPGPAVRVTSVNSAATGSATNVVPDQVATSLTFRTCSRLHWGRMYLPQVTSANYTTYGKVTSAVVNALGDAAESWLESLDTVDVGGSGITPVVRSPLHGGLLSIDVIAVDDVPDVIRSRRAKVRTAINEADA